MFALPLRRQLVVAVVFVGAVLIDNAIHGGYDDLVTQLVELALVCFAPAAFAWSLHAYRIAAGVLAAVDTIGTIELLTTGTGVVGIPAIAIMWLTLLPWRYTRAGKVTDYWMYNHRLRTSRRQSPQEEP